MTSFCDSLREGCGELWQGLHRHPFLRELADGTLAPERFRFFLEQDIFFLPELARRDAIVSAAQSATVSRIAAIMSRAFCGLRWVDMIFKRGDHGFDGKHLGLSRRLRELDQLR